jgi:hypothetical protein
LGILGLDLFLNTLSLVLEQNQDVAVEQAA